MTSRDLAKIVRYIAEKAVELKNKYCEEKELEADYVCIFAQSETKYQELSKTANKLGVVVSDTPTGFVYHLNSYIPTKAGELKLLKVRKVDSTRPQRGDVDFNTTYLAFKRKYYGRAGFKLINRTDYEMIELKDLEFDVLAYFSSSPLMEELGIK